MTLLTFRVLGGVIAVLAVTTMQSHLLTRLYEQAVAAVSVAIGS